MSSLALPTGSRILVTGVNGYIASHVADQLLQAGYHVRGTARDESKIAMIRTTLLERNPQGSFEGFVLNDMTPKGAFDAAVADTAGVIHLATEVGFSPDPNKVVPQVVDAMKNILESIAKTPSVERFVYTSSSIAAVRPKPNTKIRVDSSSWNEEDVKSAWAPPPYEPLRAFDVYGASKVSGEKTGWAFMDAAPRSFVFNTMLPNFAVGPILNPAQAGSTAGWIRGLHAGDAALTEQVRTFPPQWSVDVRDVARLHLAALLDDDVRSERLFAFAEPVNYSRFVDVLKKVDGARKGGYPEPIEGQGEDLMDVDNARCVELLRRMGRDGFLTLEESLRNQVEFRR